MEKVCFNCAKCSMKYPALTDVCDIDEHPISDVFKEACDGFIPSEEGETQK